MYFFKFTNADPTDLSLGVPIQGYDSAMWIERYSEPGEFEFVTKMSSGLKDALPLGTVISHTDTLDAAIVERHQIEEDAASDPVVTISGRSYTSWLENRIVGANYAYGTPAAPFTEYVLSADLTWNQIVSLINSHILTSSTVDDDDALNDNVLAYTNVLDSGASIERVVNRGNLLTRVTELLAVDDLGIRTIRKNSFSYMGDVGIGSATTSRFLIHKGVDRSNTVVFSSQNGDVDSADYLISLKSRKNAVLVQGRYVETMVVSSEAGYDRRMMYLDASDIDGSLSAAPTGGTLTSIRTKMQRRGLDALRKQKDVNIARIDISKNIRTRYRQDYDIGDIVTVSGSYGVQEKRRVVEYVEIEDENGESGHPTLAVLGE